jgi:hypothetical protein
MDTPEREALAAIIAHPKMDARSRKFMPSCGVCPKSLDAADAVLAAGYRRIEQLPPVQPGSMLVFRYPGDAGDAIGESIKGARLALESVAGHSDFLIIGLADDHEVTVDADVVERVRQAIDDEALTRTGRSLGDLASEHIARAALAALKGDAQ